MNIVILSGNVCSMYDNTNNVKITIADNFKDRTDYIKVALFKNQADFARKYIKIGDHISVQGRISTYNSNTGEAMGVIANEINFEGYKNPNKKDTSNNDDAQFENNALADISSENTEDDLPWNDEE